MPTFFSLTIDTFNAIDSILTNRAGAMNYPIFLRNLYSQCFFLK